MAMIRHTFEIQPQSGDYPLGALRTLFLQPERKLYDKINQLIEPYPMQGS